MTRARSVVVAMVCLASGCAGAGRVTPSKTAQRPESSGRAAPEPRKPATARVSSARDAAPALAALDARSEVEAQVRALRQAIALYGQFIERAEHQPEMKDAVERSKERIEDAQATIDFLLQKPAPDSR